LQKVSLTMRKFGSFLVILLILTAYGRCVADQYGALHMTGSACCQTVCCGDSHCESKEVESAENHTDSKNSNHSEESPEDQDPCQLCLILSNDAMLQGDNVKVPTPSFLELTSIHFLTTLENLFSKGFLTPQLDLLPDEPSSPPAEHRSQLRRVIAKTTPVRGPSFL